MMPTKDDHEPAFFERPFRTQATNAPRGSGRERHFSSMLWRQRRLERLLSSILHFRSGAAGTSRAFRGSGADSSGTCRAFCGSGARSSAHLEPAAALGQARAAISRASCGSRPARAVFSSPLVQARVAISSQLRLRARLERPFRAMCGSGPGAVFSSQAEPRTKALSVRNPKAPCLLCKAAEDSRAFITMHSCEKFVRP